MGRSYGDAAQLAGGLVLDTTRLKGFELDAADGTVTACAGVTLGELLERSCPLGWMVPVVPGTQHVSVGGAIASDIHGKNHGAAGTFGSHVEAIGLLTRGGLESLELTPQDDGVRGDARRHGPDRRDRCGRGSGWPPVSSPFLSVDTDRVRGPRRTRWRRCARRAGPTAWPGSTCSGRAPAAAS